MGLYVQREALIAAQKALDITGSNLTNVETPGYTRQRVDLQAIPNATGTKGYNSAVGLAGRGSEIVGVAQVRDALLDTKFRTYTSDYQDSFIKSSILGQLEDSLDNLEAEKTGFMSVVASLKSALQGYSSDNADRRELGTIVMNNARSVSDMLRSLDSHVDDISEQTLSEAQYAAKDVNNTLKQLAALNKSIKEAYINMGYTKLTQTGYEVQTQYGPLELKDNFNLLVDKLAEYGDVVMKEQEDGSYTVQFAGRMVVSQDQYAQIAFRDSSFDIPTVVGGVNATPLNDAQREELKNPDPTDLQLVILNAGVLDISTGLYTGLKNEKQWTQLTRVVNDMGREVDDFLRGDGEIVLDRLSTDPEIRKVAEDWNNHQIDDITDTAGGIKAGSIRGLLDLYNGKGAFADLGENTYEGVEYFRSLLDSFGKTFADTLNGIFNKEDHTFEDFPGAGEQVLFNYNYRYYYTDSAGNRQDASYFINMNGTLASDRFGYSSDRNLATNTYLRVSDGNGRAVNVFDFPGVTEDIKTFIDGGGTLDGANLQTIVDNYLLGAGLTDPKYALTVNETGALATALDAETSDGIAASLVVSDFWQNNPTFISEPDGYNESSALDNTWINRMIGAFSNKLAYKGDTTLYSFEEYISHYGNELGNRIQYEDKISGTSEVMLLSVTDSRDAVMGTSIDEEGINMMNYQKWYNAIARMTTAMDEALDRLINNTGRVGL
jgi:flagellar hook-associated protein FlgK